MATFNNNYVFLWPELKDEIKIYQIMLAFMCRFIVIYATRKLSLGGCKEFVCAILVHIPML